MSEKRRETWDARLLSMRSAVLDAAVVPNSALMSLKWTKMRKRHALFCLKEGTRRVLKKLSRPALLNAFHGKNE
jgi:hypothetical protein